MTGLPDFPWDTSPTRRAARAPRRHRRPVGRHAGRPGARRWSSDALRARRRRARVPDHPRHRARCARPRRAGWSAGSGSRRSTRPTRAADDRLQGAGRLAADAARARRRRPWWSSRSWPTRRTTWARGWPAPRSWRPTDGCALGPAPGRRWCGSTRRPTRPVGCCRPSTCARSWPGRASAARSSSPTSATSSSAGTQQPVSVLHPDVCGGSHEGLLAVHSLSKRSNLAGYRAGFVAGDPALVARPARGAQARRDDGARARCRRRWRRRWATTRTSSSSGRATGTVGTCCCAALLRGRLPGRALRRPGCTCG